MTEAFVAGQQVGLSRGGVAVALPLEIARDLQSNEAVRCHLRRAIRELEKSLPTVVIAAQPVGANSTISG